MQRSSCDATRSALWWMGKSSQVTGPRASQTRLPMYVQMYFLT